MSEGDDLWQFEQVAASDKARATKLENAPEWTALTQAVRGALRRSLLNGEARFAFDESGKDKKHLRAVLQFSVGEELFDWFFNARTGYRAQFRISCEKGTSENANLIATLREETGEHVRGRVVAQRLTSSFEDLGPMTASVQDLLRSFEPGLSKVWFCERLIEHGGGIKHLHVFKTGPRLVLGAGSGTWPSLYADQANAWLDLKGAFVADDRVYQLKDPATRALGLHSDGTA